MTRINTNIPSLLGAIYLNRNMSGLNTALERMASGLRLNSAKDDPAGVIVSDVLRGEITGLNDASRNVERANNIMATAEGATSGISDLLLQLKERVHAVANRADITSEEIDAAQLEIDNTIAAINQIVRSASFGGLKLLDGSLGYQTAGLSAAAISDLTVHSAPLGAAGGEVLVKVDLVTPAEKAELFFPHAATAGDVSVSFRGVDGVETLRFVAGTSSSEIVTAINSIAGTTGLTAELINGDPAQGVVIRSAGYGAKSTIAAQITSGNPADFVLEDDSGNPASSAAGVDARVSVNNSTISGDGLKVRYSNASLGFDIQLNEAWNTAGAPATTTFQITSGGALFQIGPSMGSAQQVSFGIQAVDSTHLGASSTGYLNDIISGGTCSLKSGSDPKALEAIIDAASSQITALRARIGSFQTNTLSMISDSLKQSIENVSAARSSIRDADYAVEAANATRQQILVEATRSVMALAQQVPQSVLSLLMG